MGKVEPFGQINACGEFSFFASPVFLCFQREDCNGRGNPAIGATTFDIPCSIFDILFLGGLDSFSGKWYQLILEMLKSKYFLCSSWRK
jgi:hypothetical protein